MQTHMQSGPHWNCGNNRAEFRTSILTTTNYMLFDMRNSHCWLCFASQLLCLKLCIKLLCPFRQQLHFGLFSCVGLGCSWLGTLGPNLELRDSWQNVTVFETSYLHLIFSNAHTTSCNAFNLIDSTEKIFGLRHYTVCKILFAGNVAHCQFASAKCYFTSCEQRFPLDHCPSDPKGRTIMTLMQPPDASRQTRAGKTQKVRERGCFRGCQYWKAEG